jgi:hypothetical protein
MAVDALELKPRNAVALVDAAVRVTATSSGLWALVLPSGAALVAATFFAAEAVRMRQSLALPTLALSAAWVFRAVTQGAAAHYLGQLVIGTSANVSTWQSLKAALLRLPALLTASVVMLVIDSALLCFTLGFGFLFVGAHVAGLAATMRGQGSVVGLYGTCAKLLGPARLIAPWARFINVTQVILVVNLHAATALLLKMGSGLFGFDLTFVDRFASIDNGTWVALLAVVSFALFEPIRAALGALLLIDGRVRLEGLDVLAAAEQLPKRGRSRLAAAAVLTLALSVPAGAQENGTALQRLVDAAETCAIDMSPEAKASAGALQQTDAPALQRFVHAVERAAYDDEDCDATQALLTEGVGLLEEARVAQQEADASAARQSAQTILERPEFKQAPQLPVDDPETPEDASEGWLARQLRKFFEWFAEWLRNQRPNPLPEADAGGVGAMAGAKAVMVVGAILLVAVLIFIAVQWFRNRNEVAEAGETSSTATPLETDPMSALAQAPESWAGLADSLAAKGEYREAIRHLYLALLSTLHRAGHIDYEPTLSNWDYLRHFRGPVSAKPPFRELTSRFDFAWYGNVDVTQETWAAFRSLSAPLLTVSEPARA